MGIVSVRAAFQCKRWESAVGRPAIDEFRGATQGKYDQAIFLTTSRFTDEARQDSIRAGCIPIVLVDGDAVLNLMVEHRIGIVSQPLNVPMIDEDFFVEIGGIP
jgi:restriction system protein